MNGMGILRHNRGRCIGKPKSALGILTATVALMAAPHVGMAQTPELFTGGTVTTSAYNYMANDPAAWSLFRPSVGEEVVGQYTAAQCSDGELQGVVVTFRAFTSPNYGSQERTVTFSYGNLDANNRRDARPKNIVQFRIDTDRPISNDRFGSNTTFIVGDNGTFTGTPSKLPAVNGFIPYKIDLLNGYFTANQVTGHTGGAFRASATVNCLSQCNDGIDNDTDGLTDRVDPGCWSDPSNPSSYDKNRNDESAATTECQDGKDNDGDGLTDYNDPGCKNSTGAPDPTRNSELTQCQDRVDNDGDSLTDKKDPGCWSDPTNPQSYDQHRNDESAANIHCGDGIDNDGDGLIDALDPGCWDNPLDPGSYNKDRTSEVHTDQSVLNIIGECVQDNKNGTFTAYFSYENTAQVGLVATNGGATVNLVTPGDVNRGQPTIFRKGVQKGAFLLVFDGKPLTWKVKPAGVKPSEATVSSSAVACKAVKPVVGCIGSDAQGLSATMGYENPNPFTIVVEKGSDNLVEPAPLQGSQPEAFAPGNNPGSFSLRIAGPFSWTLQGTKVNISSSTPICPGGCLDTPVGAVTSQVDATATQLAALTKKAADRLLAQAKKTRSQKVIRKARVDGQRATRKANNYLEEVKKLTIAFPVVVKNCPTLAPFCATVDRTATITALQDIYLKMADSTTRFTARTDFKRSGSTNRRNPLIAEAKRLRSFGLTEIAKLPATATECK